MSSTHPNASSQQPEPITKKKFGKNLNKLTKPPAPPVSSSGAANSRTGGASRNGLLLLSTKRSSTSTQSASSSSGAIGGGLLSGHKQSAPKPLNTLTLGKESSTSAHDALLTAAFGASRGDSQQTPQQPQAWGLAEKSQQSNLPSDDARKTLQAPILAPKGGVSSGYHAPVSSSNQESGSERRFNEGDGRRHQQDSASVAAPPPSRFERSGGRPRYDGDDNDRFGDDGRNWRGGAQYPRRGSSGGSSASPNVTVQSSPRPGGAVGDNAENFRSRQADERTVVPPTADFENGGGTTDEQIMYMSRLARERAEKRRAEEEARLQEQKERAARRLKELEEKMSSSGDKTESKSDSNGPAMMSDPSAGVMASRSDSLDVQSAVSKGTGNVGASSHIPKSEVRLERLGRTKAGGNRNSDGFMTGGGRSSTMASGAGGRTLFDPNRTYSSLVGGRAAQKESSGRTDVETTTLQQTARSSEAAEPYTHSAHGSGGTTMDDQPTFPVIHLSSYEDRDRGERKSSAGPRMLFDPKSGAMVAVPSREEGSSSKAGRKDRNKQKGRTGRERDVNASPLQKTASPGYSENDRKQSSTSNGSASSMNEISLLKPTRKAKGRKDEVASQRKDRRRVEKDVLSHSSSVDSPSSVGTDEGNEIPAPGAQSKVGNRSRKSRQVATSPETPRMPRTCGVLYTVDDQGNYVCADGCDPDNGYGSHSVPGGRLRNPAAYTIFLEQQQQHYQQEDPSTLTGSGAAYASDPSHERFDGHHTADPHHYHVSGETMTNAGVMGYGSITHQDSLSSRREQLDSPKVDWVPVKPNEKIELVTGADESPTLQATAHPWAPSEAALAAAAAAKGRPSEESGVVTAAVGTIFMKADEEDDSDERSMAGSPSFVGLGFDPTENMDSVMMSPSVRPEAGDDDIVPVDLTALSLGAAGRTETTSGNIFGPLDLGSSTWGTGGSLHTTSGGTASLGSVTVGGLANWDVLGTGNIDSAFGSDDVASRKGKNSVGAASFLSLSSLSVNHDSKTWGTAGLTGLGGTTLTGSRVVDKGAGATTTD